MKPSINHPTATYAATFLASLALSFVAYLQSDIINNDGILYIDVARAYVTDGLADAFAAFNWPLYGILIGLIHQVTQLDYETSAHLLNALLIAVASVTFVATYREIDRPGTRLWVAAVLILALPLVNNYRDFVIRDFGYWALLLLAVLLFVRSVRLDSLGYAIAWQLTALLAIAFRIEGVVLLAAPLVYYLAIDRVRPGRARRLLRSSLFFVGLVVAGSVGLAIVGTLDTDANTDTLRLWLSYASPVSIVTGLEQQAITLHQQLEYLSSTGDAALILVAGLFALSVSKLFANAVPMYCLVAGYGRYRNWLASTPGSRVLWLFIVLTLATMLALVASRYFLSSRYTVAPVLLLSLVTFAYVDNGLQRLAELPKRHWLVAAWVLIAVIFADGVVSTGASKKAIKTGSQWALQEVDQSLPWLCNEARLRFYTRQQCTLMERAELLAALRNAAQETAPTVVLLWVGRKDVELQQALSASSRLSPIKRWQNRRGDTMAIYTAGPKPAGNPVDNG
ncbi:MAG: hypothetical protein QNJ91_16070 [Gammaproteobacteria bacterium]|nr:hypothetical protein [Gammaproteobacteria bacterium]